MRKEIWALIAIVAIILGAIFLVSHFNRKHGFKKRKIMRADQRNFCTLFTHMARSYGLPFTPKECERQIVGLGSSKWKPFVHCMKTHRKDDLGSLACIGRRLCDLERPEGCLLEGAAMIASAKPALVDRGLLTLLSRCRSRQAGSCDYLVAWLMRSGTGLKDARKVSQDSGKSARLSREQILQDALVHSCRLGRTRACRRLKKDPVLEACAREDIVPCIKGAGTSRDPLVHFLACSLGRSASCGAMVDSLLGSHPKSPLPLLLSSADACLKGDFRACSRVARATRSTGLGAFACRNGGAGGCRFLADQDIEGPRRRYLLYSLCGRGEVDACQKLHRMLAPHSETR